MKILFIGWFFYPKLGGVESIMLNQATYFVRLGYEVSVLTSRIRNLPDNDNFEGIRIFRRDFINSEKKFDPKKITGELKKIFDDINPEIVHFHNGSYPSASVDMNSGAQNIKAIFSFIKSRDIVVIDHAHNAQLKNPKITKQLRDLKWDCLICVSNFVKKRWELLKTNALRIKVVYNGIDWSKFQNVKPAKEILELRKKNEKIIFFPSRVVSMSLGRISRQKNFRLMLKACGILKEKKHSNFRLVAILNESERERNTQESYQELEDLIKRYDLNENIDFVSTIEPDNMPEYYAASDIICVPSIEETFGMVYLEAMASKKIAIASNTGGPTEYIKDKQNGFLIDPDNEIELANILEEIIEEKVDVKKIELEASKSSKNFSIEKMCQSIEKIYKELVES